LLYLAAVCGEWRKQKMVGIGLPTRF